MSTSMNAPPARPGRRGALAQGFASLGLSMAALISLWYGLIWFLGMDDFFAKRPEDVARFLLVGDQAAANRKDVLDPLLVTLVNAGIGFVVGTLVALVVATLFAVVPAARAALMPLCLGLQAVPMLAMIPLIVLIFGRGLLGVTVVTSMVTFFPTLVNVVVAMGRSSTSLRELMTAYNGSRLQVLVRLELPTALPSLLGSLRVAIPRALLGALLAEWLASGNGLGYAMVYATTTANFSLLWTSVVAISVVSLAGYSLVAGIERAVLSRLGFTS